MKKIESLLILIFLFSLSACRQESERSNLTLLSDQIPTDTALPFGKGIISTKQSFESPITFNLDMTELFFGRKKPKEKNEPTPTQGYGVSLSAKSFFIDSRVGELGIPQGLKFTP